MFVVCYIPELDCRCVLHSYEINENQSFLSQDKFLPWGFLWRYPSQPDWCSAWNFAVALLSFVLPQKRLVVCSFLWKLEEISLQKILPPVWIQSCIRYFPANSEGSTRLWPHLFQISSECGLSCQIRACSYLSGLLCPCTCTVQLGSWSRFDEIHLAKKRSHQ